MACKGSEFKSPQLHQAQRTSRAPSERHLPVICQNTAVATTTLCALSGLDGLEGLRSDFQHYLEALLDRH